MSDIIVFSITNIGFANTSLRTYYIWEELQSGFLGKESLNKRGNYIRGFTYAAKIIESLTDHSIQVTVFCDLSKVEGGKEMGKKNDIKKKKKKE